MTAEPPMTAAPRPESPWLGLVAYTEADSLFFFGRETDRCWRNAHRLRWAVLYVALKDVKQRCRPDIARERKAGNPFKQGGRPYAHDSSQRRHALLGCLVGLFLALARLHLLHLHPGYDSC